MSNATLSFLPWVRQGAASAITADASSTIPVAQVSANLTLNGDALPEVRIALRGPADVIGIDANQVVRTDPRPETTDFEPNCFASVEFDRPDFPWLFTPTRAGDDDRLRPWLCLVVVRKQVGVTLTSGNDAPLPKLTITSPAVPATELPDLTDSWAWAHAQVAANNGTNDSLDRVRAAIDQAFLGGPELTLSRLVCPRFLEHDTDYIACVVPTFEVGRRVGIGDPIPETDTARWKLTPAWSIAAKPDTVVLPVYYRWEFRTGQEGDFESLARRLTPGVPKGLGARTIDVSQPGFDAAGAHTVELESALVPVPATVRPGPPPMPDPIPAAFKTHLASIINPATQPRAAGDTSDPLLAPPMYGQWHAARAVVDPQGTSWLDQLNLDPRWRVVAALGTRVVQEHQEALMASAWDQAGELAAANQRRRQLQLSLAVGEVLYQQHFATPEVTEEMMIRVAAPAFGRLKNAAETGSMLATQTQTFLPVAATRAAMRRIGRQRGPLTRRIVAKGFSRSATDTWVARLNQMWPAASPPPTPPSPPPALYVSLPSLTLYTQALQYTSDHKPTSFYGAFFVAAERAPVSAPGTRVPQQRVEAPDFFRSAAREHLNRVFPPRPMVIRPHFMLSPFQGVRDQVLLEADPRKTIKELAESVVTLGDGILKPTAPNVQPNGVEAIMAPPSFPQPMYEALRDMSQDLLITGLDKVAPESVLGLETNRRFVEAYMVGLNHEMGRELLWRGYPTDQRGTYFDRFWGNGVPNTAPPDITDLNTWSIPDPVTHQQRQLGDTVGAPTVAEEFVLVMRSSLLRRYPNAVIYLAPAKKAGAGAPNPDALVPDVTLEREVQPIFSGSAKPDVVFFGFNVAADAAIGGNGGGTGNLGYYVIIQEHPTEPRFGVDVSFTKTGSHLAVTAKAPDGLDLQGGAWNTNAAQMARVTRRLPIRIAIHAARLITPA